MKNLKISNENLGKYLREISIVVIGVAITLSAGYWITNRNEKRDMALYLNTIKLELEENKKNINETIERVQSSVKYSNYLRSHDKKSLNPDTIKAYSPTYHDVSTIIIKTNAFDMFKTSGNMRLVDDKELLLSIWDAYAVLGETADGFNMFMRVKLEDIQKEYHLFSLFDIALLSAEEILKNVPMYDFYVHTAVPHTQIQICEKALMKTIETISKLEEMK